VRHPQVCLHYNAAVSAALPRLILFGRWGVRARSGLPGRTALYNAQQHLKNTAIAKKSHTTTGACRFVAEYVTFEPLEKPLHPPQNLPSPHSVLAWQAGDSFDCAVVLASLLLGAGFDAYVVMGYAPRPVTLGDLQREECPLLTAGSGDATAAAGAAGAKAGGSSEASSASTAAAAGAAATGKAAAGTAAAGAGGKQHQAAAEEPGKRKKYQLRPRPTFTSKFLEAKEAEAAKAAAEAAEAAQQEAPNQAAASARQSIDAQAAAAARSSVSSGGGLTVGGDDSSAAVAGEGNQAAASAEEGVEEEGFERPGHSKRVHAWVLVLPGRRDVIEPLFLEPSTGRRYTPAACPYEGVEFVWNAANFWVCMQVGRLIAISSVYCSAVSGMPEWSQSHPSLLPLTNTHQAPEPHSDARAVPSAVSWDLSDATKWETVLDPSQTR